MFGNKKYDTGDESRIIGLYLLLLLGKAGTTTITFFLVPPGKVLLPGN